MTNDPVFWFVLVWPVVAAAFAIFAAFVIFPRFDKWVDVRFPIKRAQAEPSRHPAE